MSKTKNISILGSTGSIGVQTLDVIRRMNQQFSINFLTANKNFELLEQQSKEFNPKGLVLASEISYKEFKRTTSFNGVILCGEEGLIAAAADSDNDMVVSALVGFSGVKPTLAAINASHTVALANKETLVSAGNIITEEAKKYNVKIIAIDSEHSAVLQCLAGEEHSYIEKIILTASGGPFRNLPLEDFQFITVKDALNHPNWAMGNKITIDSATMMNKGFEVIEAKWLFDIDVSKIDVVIHPQSIIHSMVQFRDGSIKAQLGLPDMRIPISYSLTYPARYEFDFPRLNLLEISHLEFMAPDLLRYPCLKLAYSAIEKAGNFTCALNAANEECVYSFLAGKIQFNDIAVIIEKVLEKIDFFENPVLDEILNTDKETRILTNLLINN